VGHLKNIGGAENLRAITKRGLKYGETLKRLADIAGITVAWQKKKKKKKTTNTQGGGRVEGEGRKKGGEREVQ